MKGDILYFSNIKIGAQNGAPEWQFKLDWRGCNLSLPQFLKVVLLLRRYGLRLCMSKSAHELFSSIQSLIVKFWTIFKPTAPKNMEFSDFWANPLHYCNPGGSVLGSEVIKTPESQTSEKTGNFLYLSFFLKMHQCWRTIPSHENTLDSWPWLSTHEN